MKYHVKITDNETGEVLRDMDTDAIVASIHAEDYTAEVVMTDCHTPALAMVVGVLLKILDHLKKNAREAYILAKKEYKRFEKENNDNE